MYSINPRKKSSNLFLTFFVVLLSIVSTSSASIGFASETGENNLSESKRFAFLSNNPANFLFGNQNGNVAQNAFDSSFATYSSEAKDILDLSIFDEFDAWVKDYTENSYQADDAQAGTGESLAIRRRALLKQLIETNPRTALSKALSAETIRRLPEYITKHTEKPVSANGDFLVYVFDSLNHLNDEGIHGKNLNGSRTERAVVIGESRYKASVYGRREAMTTKMDIPLHGIVIDDRIALDESPARIISKKNSIAQIGERRVSFSNEAEMDSYISEQIEWESKIGPARPTAGKANLEKSRSKAETLAAEQTASSWTTGPKTLLVIRVDFRDATGEPRDYNGGVFTRERAENLYNNEVNTFFVNNSYRLTSIRATVVPELIRLPETLTYYRDQYAQSGGYEKMIADARNQARAKGFDTNNFDLDVVAFTYIGGFVGLSTIGSKGSILNGGFFLAEAAHELGHNYGLLHANLWRTTGSPIGPGFNYEYGDCFDMMGADCPINLGQENHFNARYKRLLDWLTETNVKTVTSTGEYRLYAQDTTTNDGTTRALKINKNEEKNYWIEFRQAIAGNQNAANGAILRWDYASRNYQETQLLDMNPGGNTSDAPLLVGAPPLQDNENGIKITVLRKNAAPASLDIKVELNSNCTYSLSPANSHIDAAGGGTIINVITRSDCPWTATSNVPWLTFTNGNSGTGNGSLTVAVQPNSTTERTGIVTVGGQTFSITQSSGSCSYTVTPTYFNVSANGGTLNYTQTSDPGCFPLVPTSTGTSPWISINNNTVTVLPNNGSVREGKVRLAVDDINGLTKEVILTVYQEAGQGTNCVFPLSPTSQNFTASGGAGVFSIKSPNGACVSTYTAASNVSWITINNPSGQTNDNINFVVAQNTGGSRTGTVTINNPIVGSQVFTVNQAAATACTFAVNPSNQSFAQSGGAGNFSLTASDPSCSWSAAASNSWISITSGTTGTGSATINFNVSANNAQARTGTITIGGNVFTINQSSGCNYSLQPSSSGILNSSGASGSFEIQTASGCSWTATTGNSWITINSNASGSGNGTVGFSVAANAGAARSGTITAGGQTFTVNQAANCVFTLSSTNASVGNGGENRSVNITSGAGCTWTAVSNDSWITVTSGSGGSGNGTVSFSVAANSGAARSGTITIAGQTFTVNQAAGCTFSLSSANSGFEESGGNGTLNVTSGTGCAWTAAANVSWITFNGNTNGSGNGAVNFSVAANTGAARTGTITVGGQAFTITQAAFTVIPGVSINNISLVEGNSGTTPFVFNVNLSTASNQTVSVNFATANGTAVAGEDYNAANGTLTFAPGETSKTIAVSIIGDAVIEPNETFTVNLSNAVNATISGGAGTGTIQNDDAGGSLQFSLSNYTVNENAGTAAVTVTRTGGAASGVFVNYSTANGTATAGQDYTAASGTLTFGANETSKTFTVSITNDSISEPNETVNLTLSNAVGGTLGAQATAVLTIIDDDGAPTLSIGNVSVNEGNAGTTAFEFTVSLLGTSSQTVTVNYSTANGTATAPGDFQPVSGSLSFASGETVKTVTVFVNGDTEVEANETFTVNLSNAANAAIANGTGTGTVQNDDVACSYSIAPPFLNANANGGSGNTIFVTTQAGCAWTAATSDSFITINSGANGSGSGTVGFTVAANTGAARIGTILVAGQTFTVNQTAGTIAPGKVLFDFDGDGKSDVTVFRPDNGVWYQLNSATGFAAKQFGISSDKIAPADFDGDNKTDFAVFREGTWYLQRSSAGFASIPFGSPGDVPVPADFDGDGRAELVVFRPSNGIWYSLNLVDNAFSAVQFGSSEDKPVMADYDGDGRADQAVYRPSNGVWYMRKSRDGFAAVQFGVSTDKPVVGDFDGDGRADQAVYRPESGTWYLLRSRDGFAAIQFGLPTDIPAPGDYDGDGKTDIAVFRPENGNWFQMKSTQGFGSVQFGANGDKPIPNSLVR